MEKLQSFYTIPEVAEILGISRVAVFLRVKAGQIKAKRKGRIYHIPRSAIYGVLQERTKRQIEVAVKRVVEEYGEVLRQLGKE